MQPYHQALKPGTILQGGSYTYRIESVLGQGSFGITYLATTRIKVQGALGELETDMQIAIKEFFLKEMNSRKATGVVAESSQGSLADKYGRKFLKEAENLSHLHHPNIVRVLEVFSTNHTHYYAMEYVKGGSLDDYIKEWKGLPEKESIESIRTIGKALAYMHSCKMLHLDLKPRNIMRRDDGNLYLIDFGISKQYDAKGEPESSTTIGLGTPGYAPIEQGNIQDSKDFAVTLDIYALGATLYKMLTGQTPPNASVVMNEGFPEEELRKRNISEQTIGAIRQAMAPMKRVRPQSVEAFLESLGNKQTIPNDEETVFICKQREKEEEERKKIEKVRQKQQEIKRPNRISKQNQLVKGVVGVAIAVVLAVFIWFIGRPDGTLGMNPQAQLTTVEEYNLQTNSNEPSEGWLIDLGLSVKWASYNVGASSPEDYGGLYLWADPTGEKTITNDDDHPSSNIPENISGTQYDIARAKWGGWRLPKPEEFIELCERCNWDWIKYKGVNGYLVTGPNGNRIFLPAAGNSFFGETIDQGSSGRYWSGTKLGSTGASCLGFDSDNRHPLGGSSYCFGNSVRPVSD